MIGRDDRVCVYAVDFAFASTMLTCVSIRHLFVPAFVVVDRRLYSSI